MVGIIKLYVFFNICLVNDGFVKYYQL